MPVSDNFTKLKDKVDSADRDIREAAARDTAELKAMVDQARRKADAPKLPSCKPRRGRQLTKPSVSGTRCKEIGTGTSSAFGDASKRKRRRTTWTSPNATPSGLSWMRSTRH